MITKEIAAGLVKLQAALVDKLEAQPWTDVALWVTQGGICRIAIYGDSFEYGTSRIDTAEGDTFEAAFIKAYAMVAALPDKEDAAKHAFRKNLADVIDEGNSLNMPTDVMAPLSDGMKALSENLLTHQVEAA